MSTIEPIVLHGIDEFESIAQEWDELWWRSPARQPVGLSSSLKNWFQSFAPGEPITTIGVRAAGQLVAAIPLIRDCVRGLFPRYGLPVNCWANSGDLLLDPSVDSEQVLEQLVGAMEQQGIRFLSLDEVTLDAPQWIGFQRVVQSRGGHCLMSEESPVGVVDVLHDWDRYEQSWSGNHRGAVKRSYKKLRKQGDVRAQWYGGLDEPQSTDLLRLAFEIEDRSWKGAAGSSVAKTPGMLEFMIREARAMARAECLHLWFLYFNDRPIAFEYCHYAKGVCFSHKIGYEPDCAKFGPGRLLRYLQLKHYHADPACREFDMLGTLCKSKANWATRTYATGRLHAAIGRGWTPMVLRGLAWVQPRLNGFQRRREVTSPKLGAAGTLDGSGAELAT